MRRPSAQSASEASGSPKAKRADTSRADGGGGPRAERAAGRSPTRLLIVVSLALASCTLTRTSVDKCKANADCRTAFGSGFVCGGDGLCTLAPPNPRCTETFPPDVLTRPQSYPGVVLLGYEILRGIDTQQARANAVRLAATQVNEKGGLGARQFGVVFCDVAENTQYDSLKRTDAAVADAKYLVDVIGVPAIIGPSASPDVLAVFQAVKGEDVLVISPSATSPELTSADITMTPTDDRPGLLWRTAPSDVLQGVAIDKYLVSLSPSVTNVAMIEESGAYGEGLGGVFADAFTKAGRTVKAIPFASGVSSERDAAVVAAPGTMPQYVLFLSSLSADGIAFLEAVGSLGSYAKIDLFLTDSAANKDVLTGAMSASSVFPRVAGSRPSVPAGPVHDLFRTSYSAAFKQDPDEFTFVAHAYDAAWLVFYGAAWAVLHEHALSGTPIARGLRHVSAGEALDVSPANWEHIRDTLAAGQSVNVTGASGALDYDPATEETTGLVDIWKISPDGTQIQTVTTIDPRQTP